MTSKKKLGYVNEVKIRRKPSARSIALYERGFLILLVILCLTLTALQYRWTGQISTAETERIGRNLKDSLQTLCLRFDSELAQSCSALRPDAEDIDEQGLEKTHVEMFNRWKASKARPIFKRIGYAVPQLTQLRLYMVQDGRLLATNWPEEWKDLRKNLEGKLGGPGRTQAFRDRDGLIFEFPVFGSRIRQFSASEPMREGAGPRGAGEREWAIFELDKDYLRTKWFPRRVRQYVGQSNTGLLARVEIKTRSSPPKTIYLAGQEAQVAIQKPTLILFNRRGGSIGPADNERSASWTLEALQSPDKLAALVSVTRWRNLGVALVLNLSLLAAGIAFIRLTRRSRRLAQAQMQFVANVSHELRTPLTVIRGAGHNLMTRVVQNPEKVQEYSTLIVQHAEQLSEMVEQILDLGRARNMPAVPTQAVDVAKVVTDAITATAEEAKGVSVEVQLAPGLRTISSDPSMLQRAFQNLITNAAKHAATGGWVGVTAVVDEHIEPSMVEIQVADRGGGIPQEELDAIFEPFYRGATAQAYQVRGSGLGLTLVKEIVESHGGSVRVESEEGQGTTFTVRLPSANGHAPT